MIIMSMQFNKSILLFILLTIYCIVSISEAQKNKKKQSLKQDLKKTKGQDAVFIDDKVILEEGSGSSPSQQHSIDVSSHDTDLESSGIDPDDEDFHSTAGSGDEMIDSTTIMALQHTTPILTSTTEETDSSEYDSTTVIHTQPVIIVNQYHETISTIKPNQSRLTSSSIDQNPFMESSSTVDINIKTTKYNEDKEDSNEEYDITTTLQSNTLSNVKDIKLQLEKEEQEEEDSKEFQPTKPFDEDFKIGKTPRRSSLDIFMKPGVLAAVIGGAVIGLLAAMLLVMFIIHRMRKKDEGSYPLDEPSGITNSTSKSVSNVTAYPSYNLYNKAPTREFYA